MAKVVLAQGLVRWLPAEGGASARELALEVDATTLHGALERAFALHPALRGYVLDDHGVVRQHVAIFVDGRSIADKSALNVPVSAQSDIYVMQALSGG